MVHSCNVVDEPLSVTVSPGSQMPKLDRYPDAEAEGEFIFLGQRWEMAEPPPELYTRQARQLDRSNPVPVALEVARTVGGLFAPEDIGSGYARDLGTGAADGARERFAARYGRTYESVELEAGRGWRVHVDEIAYRLRVLYMLGRHAVAYRRGDYLVPAWTEMLDPPQRFRSERQAWEMFSRFIDPALAVFHPRVLVQYEEGHPPGEQGATFLEAGALQIVNDLARRADYLTCPNCGTIFARQVGGSTHYSRRTGVTYCTPQCATATRVKTYRARKRAEGNG
jgi:hypothetical protein